MCCGLKTDLSDLSNHKQLHKLTLLPILDMNQLQQLNDQIEDMKTKPRSILSVTKYDIMQVTE